jgi:uncharacterized protein
MDNKRIELVNLLRAMQRVVVAYSGGVDSTLLLKIAVDTLGDGAVAVTAVSASLAADERREAEEIARQIGARHILIESHEMEDARYLENSPQRCYFCKNEVYDQLVAFARDNGFTFVIDGTNADDAHDHRPGRRAAEQWGVRSPLLEVGLTKDEIRTLAREAGLPNWDKPAAACLSSRIPYGTRIDLDSLAQVEQAEQLLRQIGLRQVRVRHHGNVARIEVEPVDFPRVLAYREQILTELKAAGYQYISLDLAGFRSGSMNEVLRAEHGPREAAPASG